MHHTPLSSPAHESNPTSEATTLPFAAYTHFPRAEAELERLLAQIKLQMPESFRAKWVSYRPWLLLLFLPFQLYGVLALLTFASFGLLLGQPLSIFSPLLSLATLACSALALPGLFKRTRAGWTFSLYFHALNLIDCTLSLNLLMLPLVIALLWATFQIKYRYR